MNTDQHFPAFDTVLEDLNRFILSLVDEYHAGKLTSWDDLDCTVKAYFTLEKMEEVEAIVPGWKKMASYSNGITLTHVMCVFLGVYMMPEFQTLTPEQQQIVKWIVMFHDIDKFHIRGQKDTMHAFRSAVITANTLPGCGFPIAPKYPELIKAWSELTSNAFTAHDGATAPKPDNRKLPEILMGIDQLFEENAPAALITKSVLLHISLGVDPEYPTPAPLTDDEIECFIAPGLFPLLQVMMLGDNEGWTLFEPEDRVRKRTDTLAAFREVEKIIRG